MGTTEMRSEQANPSAEALDMKIEVVVLPVADVDRAKRFYKGLGWREDADFSAGDDFRVVQLTPPGSPCSIHFGKGLTAAAPGSIQGLYLVVDDIEAARTELNGHGADVSGVFHYTQTRQRVPGADPERPSYGSYATFTDPDGNRWLVQEIRTRLPGRGFSSDVATLTDLLQEAEKRHGAYEPTSPKHHWSGWYAAYIIARERGKTPDQAAQNAALHMENERRAPQTDR
jgi:catechol 2,3-dioxygenase-like lactoylglutathione lyase family enzyme